MHPLFPLDFHLHSRVAATEKERALIQYFVEGKHIACKACIVTRYFSEGRCDHHLLDRLVLWSAFERVKDQLHVLLIVQTAVKRLSELKVEKTDMAGLQSTG